MCSEADFSAPDQLCTGSTHSSLEPFRGRFSGPGAISPREAGIRIRADQPCPMGWPASAASDASARAPSALARLISSRAAHRCAAVVAQARRDPGCATPRSTPSPSWCHSGAHRAAAVRVSRVRPCSHRACWAGCAGARGQLEEGLGRAGARSQVLLRRRARALPRTHTPPIRAEAEKSACAALSMGLGRDHKKAPTISGVYLPSGSDIRSPHPVPQGGRCPM
jgi:hypothetical protein